MAFALELHESDGEGGIVVQWRDATTTPTTRCSLRLGKDGMLGFTVFDRTRVRRVVEATNNAIVVDELRKTLKITGK